MSCCRWLIPPVFVAEFVDALDPEDWKGLCVDIEGDPMGAPAYHPRALLSIWLLWVRDGNTLQPQAGGGLPGPDTLSVAYRLATTRTTTLCGGSTRIIARQ